MGAGRFYGDEDTTLNGEPTFIWAPNMYLMEHSYMAAPEVLISESIGPSTADAFTDLPKWITSRGAGAKNMRQVTISSVRGHTAITPVFTSQLYGTGVGGDNSYYLSTYHDFVICGVQSERVNGGAYVRGACLTDTIWGAGFGVNTDKRSYAMCFRSPVSLTTPVTVVQYDAGTGVASGTTLGPLAGSAAPCAVCLAPEHCRAQRVHPRPAGPRARPAWRWRVTIAVTIPDNHHGRLGTAARPVCPASHRR